MSQESLDIPTEWWLDWSGLPDRLKWYGFCGPLTRKCRPSQCPSTASDAEDAARFYAKTFPDSSVGAVHPAPGDFPSGKKGDVLTVEFTVMGIPCLGLNGGSAFKHNEAFSFQVATADQAETDRYWNAIVGNGGEESACGWCKDRWGLSWQITPIALTKAITDPDPAVAKRAFDAMMEMKKIDIAAIEAARRG
jgi:predicted 3-demethylubiquinone-9 3-methyltransferase (glyoxalase superfamily)